MTLFVPILLYDLSLSLSKKRKKQKGERGREKGEKEKKGEEEEEKGKLGIPIIGRKQDNFEKKRVKLNQ